MSGQEASRFLAPAPAAKPDQGAGVRPGRPEAAEAIWDWRGAQRQQDLSRERQEARRQGALQALVACALAAALVLSGHPRIGRIVLGMAVLTLVAALVSPAAGYAWIRRATGALAWAVGRGVTWMLLVPLFYAGFTLLGLVRRRGSRDPLERRFDPGARTYWRERPAPPGGSSGYERQF